MKPGHALLLVIVVGTTVWYLVDAIGVSTRLTNIILIVPLAAIVLAAASFETIRAFVKPEQAPDPDAETDEPQTGADLARASALLALLGLLAFLYERIGLDIAVFVFMTAALILLEPRGVVAKLAFALVFTIVVVWGAKAILPYPMPTTFL